MALLHCGKCNAPLDAAGFAGGGTRPCPACGRKLTACIFPAFSQPRQTAKADSIATAEESSCFYHAANRATRVCDQCGRFICSVCDIEIGDRHLCPTCVESGVRKKSEARLENSRILYGTIAMWTAVISLIPPILYLSIITAPMAIFTAIFFWKKPGSITGQGHARHVFAILLATLEIIGWIAVVYFITRAAHAAHPGTAPHG